jgi:hypothetical protein
MNFLFFGIILIEFCSASRCRREKDRIKELNHQKRELQIERDELAAEKGRFCNECFDEIDVRFNCFFEIGFFLGAERDN